MHRTKNYMIRVKVGVSFYEWSKTDICGLYVCNLTGKNIMLCNLSKFDGYIVNNAHEYANIKLFAKLCKEKNKLALLCGKINSFTKSLLEIADTFEKIN